MDEINKLQNINWDTIVIGTGISGGTVGYALAKKGKKILFIEKGPSRDKLKTKLISGEFPESKDDFTKDNKSKVETLKSALRCTSLIIDSTSSKNKIPFIPLIGEGVGGSSSIYGAALERFFPDDFTPEKFFSDTKNANVANWPITYNDLERYYDEAEKLYNVYGDPDPLRLNFQSTTLKKRKLSPSGKKIFNIWKNKKLNPYKLPVAHLPHDETSCTGCQAVLCPSSDKIGSYEACIKIAIENYGATLIDECEVIKLDHDQEHVTSVQCRFKDQIIEFKGTTIILAAGALFSPSILLKSSSPIFPRGLANKSGYVGKNLCRHYFDLAMINLNPHLNGGYHEKELALNDFYVSNNIKLGTLQSLSNPPHFLSAYHEMHAERKYHNIFYSLYLHILKMFGRVFYNKIMNENLCFAVIMEDVSYLDNRLEIDADNNINIYYKMMPEAFKRLNLFRKLIKNSFAPYKVKFHKQAKNNQRLAHSTGTCRMGNDPITSVVDSHCRSHDIKNLYIVDASFFPSSSGINPALTLAANALRVADHIGQQ